MVEKQCRNASSSFLSAKARRLHDRDSIETVFESSDSADSKLIWTRRARQRCLWHIPHT